MFTREKGLKIDTFWKLIQSHRVEIPIIQRDYAQGRLDPKVSQIRKTFVKDLLSALTNARPIHLNFVYGKIKGKIDVHRLARNRKAIEGLMRSVKDYSENQDIRIKYEITETHTVNDFQIQTYLIPLDGQQRLTTLFLVHLYLLRRIGHQTEILQNFTYRTRSSSKDFCKSLVEHEWTFTPQRSLSDDIRNAKWFFSYWQSDPTVKGMLVMLDEIHVSLKDVKTNGLHDLWNSLTESDSVTFEFLDMEKFELTDELYVKMNGRGKPLSDFENFKAGVIEYVKEKGFHLGIDDWAKRLDIDWIDLFWSFKGEGVYEIDNEYFNFFKILILCFFAEKIETKGNQLTDSSRAVIDKLREDSYISFAELNEGKIVDAEVLNRIFIVLKSLENKGFEVIQSILSVIPVFEQDNFLANLLGNQNSKLTLWDRVFIYSIILFLTKKNKNLLDFEPEEKESLLRWVRVCRNLIYNTSIESPIDFVKSIQAINKLSIGCDQIYEHLQKSTDDIPFISPNQYEEEKLKSKLILRNIEWESELIKIENHDYFYYQVGFLIDFSKEEEEYGLDKFKFYSNKASEYFSKSILSSHDFWVQRALLVMGDYLVPSGSNHSFCLANNSTLRLREENWRRVFRNIEYNWIFYINIYEFNVYQFSYKEVKNHAKTGRQCNKICFLLIYYNCCNMGNI
jgi:hypothetical protein